MRVPSLSELELGALLVALFAGAYVLKRLAAGASSALWDPSIHPTEALDMTLNDAAVEGTVLQSTDPGLADAARDAAGSGY